MSFGPRLTFFLLAGTAFLVACTVAETGKKRKKSPAEPGDEFWDDEVYEEQPLEPTDINADSGAFGAGGRPKDGGAPTVDSGTVGPRVYCQGPLAAGDLAIVELLISSRAGSGDEGEWAEIKNTRTCWLKIQGVAFESPRGAQPSNIVVVSEDIELAPGASVIVADSADPAKNGGLPGKVIPWGTSDVLKNDGDTLRVKIGATVIDEVTYPAFTNLEPGRTLAFPSDYTMAQKTDWARWSLTFNTWGTGKKGTPNASNDDVACF